MSQITKNLLGALAALLLTAWQGAALGTSLSGTAAQTQTVTVHYADLDLNRPADVETLYHRINRAAYEACGIKELTGSNVPLLSWQHCVAQAVDQTVLRLDRPALTAYHHEHTIDAARKG